MPYPAGVRSVQYVIEIGENPEASVIFTATFDGAVAHDALQVGADAIVSHLETEFPSLTANAGRIYECHVSGDPWPSP